MDGVPERYAGNRQRNRGVTMGSRARGVGSLRGSDTDHSPSPYIERVSLRTGKVLAGAIDPRELLVASHRDRHPIDVAVQYVASRIVQLTGDERAGWHHMRQVNRLGRRLAHAIGYVSGSASLERGVQRLIGVSDPQYFFRFRRRTRSLNDTVAAAHLAQLRRTARNQLRRRGQPLRLRILLTGATGFVGQEIVARAAGDARIAALVCVLRPEVLRDRHTGAVVGTRSARQRGTVLLKRLGIHGKTAAKFRFVNGDIEQPGLGVRPAVAAQLHASLTHVIHAAASVSFDAPYEDSYRANVLGSRYALEFSRACQAAPRSPFIAHLAIETSYIHGRTKPSLAQEGALVFPRHFYNNYYELTKAMAAIDTDRAMIEEGLRVVQLLPSIIIGHSRTGNNRGDTKVVNAPVNAFGRVKELIENTAGGWAGRSKAWLLARMAESFPGDPSAELNLVPIDRVAAGVIAALTASEAIGRRIHLATDDRIRSEVVTRIAGEEIGVDVHLSDPTLYRTVTMPLRVQALRTLEQPQLARVMGKLASIFSAYGEWGQTVHAVGNDVRILGLPLQRPNTEHAFRMLCRHNRYVQRFGAIRDANEIARRESIWARVIDRIESDTGREAASISPHTFDQLLRTHLEPSTFARRTTLLTR